MDPNVLTLELAGGVFAVRLDQPTPQTCYTDRMRDGRMGTSRSAEADWQALIDFAKAILARQAGIA